MCGALQASAQNSGQWRDSLNTVIKKSELYPDSSDLQLQKALLYLQVSDWEKADGVCSDVLMKDAANLPALFYRAWANNNMRRYDNARSDYEDFLKIAPRNMEARLGLAYTYIKLKRNTDAMDEMNQVVEMFPDSCTAYAARAGLEKDLSMYDLALFDISKAIELSPKNQDYIIEKVDILLKSGRKGEARKVLDYAVSQGIPRGTIKDWYEKCK